MTMTSQFIDRVAVAAAKFSAALDERLPAVAQEFGLSYLPVHLFRGLPCEYGHEGVRYTRNGRCADCARERNERWRALPHQHHLVPVPTPARSTNGTDGFAADVEQHPRVIDRVHKVDRVTEGRIIPVFDAEPAQLNSDGLGHG